MADLEDSATAPRRNIKRRKLLQTGLLGGVLVSLARLLEAEAAAGVSSSSKAVVFVHLDGGPPQLDTIDLKPDASVEIRGEFSPINTSVPGISICELMPKLAAIADRVAFVRSLVGSAGAHDTFQCQSGFEAKNLQSLGGRPAFGSVVAKLLSSPNDNAPPFVDLMQGRAMDRFTEQAVGILTSGQLADALDLEKEDPRVVERYTLKSTSGQPNASSEGPKSTRKFLLARRLIDAGVRCVSLSISDFDTHSDNFPRLRHLLPIVNHGLATFIQDLEERGRLDDVTIVAWGEFIRELV